MVDSVREIRLDAEDIHVVVVTFVGFIQLEDVEEHIDLREGRKGDESIEITDDKGREKSMNRRRNKQGRQCR